MARPTPIIIPGPAGMGRNFHESSTNIELIPKEVGVALLGELLGSMDRKREGSAIRKMVSDFPELKSQADKMTDSEIALNSKMFGEQYGTALKNRQLAGVFDKLGGMSAQEGQQQQQNSGGVTMNKDASAGQTQEGAAPTKGPFGGFNMKALATLASLDPNAAIGGLIKQFMPMTQQEQATLEKTNLELAQMKEKAPLETESKKLDLEGKRRENTSQAAFHTLIQGNFNNTNGTDQRALEGQLTPGDAEKWKNWQNPGSMGPMAAQRYRGLVKKQAMGEPLSKDEQAEVKAYEKEKTLGAQAYGNSRMQIMMDMPVPVYNQENGQYEFVTRNQALNDKAYAPMSAINSDMKVMQQAAPSVKHFVEKLRQDMKQVETGPAKGRWKEFWAGKVGASDPKFTALRTDAGLLNTRLMKMHVGARGGEYMMKHFQDLFDAGKQSPENMNAALNEIESYVNEIQQPITPGAAVPKGGGGGGGGGQYSEGQTATNPKTGERLIYKGGKWQKAQ